MKNQIIKPILLFLFFLSLGCSTTPKGFELTSDKHLRHVASGVYFPESAGSFKIWPKIEAVRTVDVEGKSVSVNYYETSNAAGKNIETEASVFIYPKFQETEIEIEVAQAEARKNVTNFKVDKKTIQSVAGGKYSVRHVQYSFRGPGKFALGNVVGNQIGEVAVAESPSFTLKFKMTFDSRERDAYKKSILFVESFLEAQKDLK